MSDRFSRPSETLPSYLQAELHAPSGSFGLLGACDDFAEGVSHLAMTGLLDLFSQSASSQVQRRTLQNFGFEVDTLSDAEVISLFEVRDEIVAPRDSLSSVEALCKVYFPDAGVRVGLPYKTTALGASSRLRLGDSLQDKTVFVRLTGPSSVERREEFRHNARRCLPLGFQIVVGAAFTSAQAPQDLRRLQCRISHR